MAYQVGTATGANDLLDKFRLFAIAEGWSQNRWTAVGYGYELCIQKGSAYFNFRAYQNESVNINASSQSNKYGILLNGSDGYSAGHDWDRQPGYPKRQSGDALDQAVSWLPMEVNQGPFPSYHFFSSANSISVELEITTGTFLRFGCGSLNLFNPSAPGGGRYFYATGSKHVTAGTNWYEWLGADVNNASYALEEVPFRCASYCDITAGSGLTGSFLRVQHDSFDNWAHSSRAFNTYQTGSICQGGVHDIVIRDLAPNALNGIGVLLPCIVSLNRNNEYLNPVGVLPNIRYMDMTNYLPGDEFTIGADVWKVFPWYSKGGRSLQRGIAYLKE